MSRDATRNVVVAAGCVAVSGFVALSPWPPLAARAPRWSTAIETALILVGSLVAFLCVGRVQRSRRLGDVVLAAGLVLLALMAPVLDAVAAGLATRHGTRTLEWSASAAQLVGAALVLIAGSERVYTRRYPTSTRWRVFAGAVVVATVIGVTAVILVLAPARALGMLPAQLAVYPHPLANPFVAGVQLLGALLFASAAVQFTRLAGTRSDPLLGWIATGCVLSAVAFVDYAMFPSLDLDWVHAGDVFRSAAVVAWAVGGAIEIRSYWSEMGRVARLEERRELARDLHDGLAQELSFLVTHVQAPADLRRRGEWLAQLRAAAQRALDESRRAITVLTATNPPPLEADLTSTTELIAARTGASVQLEVHGPAPAPEHHEAIIRIVREAVTNATRHGGATMVGIELVDGSDRRLRVSDNGRGFDVDSVRRAKHGFGLLSMEERARALGASFSVRSAPGEGTTVEVSWP